MTKLFKFLYIGIVLFIVVLSYGFKDPNLTLTGNSFVVSIITLLSNVVFGSRALATAIFIGFLLLLWVMYLIVLRRSEKEIKNIMSLFVYLSIFSGILSFSYPALTHDLFNYITTAKLAFFHRENPYLVMPIEISNEPYLAFTRAANKVALYGPVWILLTAIPHYFGAGDIWQTILAFKLLNALTYLLVSYLIYQMTKSVRNVLFFALNPLVLIEILISSHNDSTMMAFLLLGILLWFSKGIGKKMTGLIAIFASILIKGATLVVAPLLFVKNISKEKFLLSTYILLALVFFILAPLREELYPWYAVWLVTIAACLDAKKYSLLIGFTLVLSFALELRHIPYMYMGYYEGVGPLARTLLTIIPIAIYGGYIGYKK